MSVVIPARSWTGQVAGLQVGTEWILLGPMAPGTVLRRLSGVVHQESASRVIFCPVLTSVGEKNVTAFRAGRPLIDDADMAVLGKPALMWDVQSNLFVSFVLWVGLPIEENARWLLCEVENASADAKLSLTVSAELVRLE